MNNKQKTKINYQKSGVNIARADKLVSSLKSGKTLMTRVCCLISEAFLVSIK